MKKMKKYCNFMTFDNLNGLRKAALRDVCLLHVQDTFYHFKP